MFGLGALVGFGGAPIGGWLADRWVIGRGSPPGWPCLHFTPGWPYASIVSSRIGRKMTIHPAACFTCAGTAGGEEVVVVVMVMLMVVVMSCVCAGMLMCTLPNSAAAEALAPG